MDKSVEKRTSQWFCQTLNFRKHCLFCKEESKDITPWNLGRWGPYYIVK